MQTVKLPTPIKHHWPVIGWAICFLLIAVAILQTWNLAQRVDHNTVLIEGQVFDNREFFSRIAVEACKANNIQDRTTMELAEEVGRDDIARDLRDAIYPCEKFTREFLEGVFRRVKRE